MARTRRRRPTVFQLNQAPRYRAPAGRPSNPNTSPKFEGDFSSALAPQQTTLGPGMESTLTPSVQEFAPEGGPVVPGAGGVGGGTALIDALAQEPAAPVAVPQQQHFEQGTLGTGPIQGSGPGGSLIAGKYLGGMFENAQFEPGFEGGQPYDATAVYNRNKLLRMLMEEGY